MKRVSVVMTDVLKYKWLFAEYFLLILPIVDDLN